MCRKLNHLIQIVLAVEVRRGKGNSNEYVLGRKEDVKKYIESQDEEGHRKTQVEDIVKLDNSSEGINERSVVQSGVQSVQLG